MLRLTAAVTCKMNLQNYVCRASSNKMHLKKQKRCSSNLKNVPPKSFDSVAGRRRLGTDSSPRGYRRLSPSPPLTLSSPSRRRQASPSAARPLPQPSPRRGPGTHAHRLLRPRSSNGFLRSAGTRWTRPGRTTASRSQQQRDRAQVPTATRNAAAIVQFFSLFFAKGFFSVKAASLVWSWF
jgi:hypothetical protein